MQSTSYRRGWISGIVAILLWVVLGLAVWQRTALYDWWRLRGYSPSSDVAQLASATTMNDKTRNLFYVYHPDIETREEFNSHCRDGEFTIVLGCYISHKGIYIFDVNDVRLDGVKEVTSAHEMLHAAYDRLSSKDRKQVDIWTNEAFNQLDNDRIKANIEQYRKNDPSSVPNELHSILGTEVRNLPAPLERYYKRYFTNRSKIVDYSDRYEAAFTERKNQADAYEVQLKQLQAEVESNNNALKSQGETLQQEFRQLESSRSSVDTATFNAQASAYNSKVRAYNQLVVSTRNLISRYNTIYEAYKQVVLEQQNLFQSIDSRPQTIQTQ